MPQYIDIEGVGTVEFPDEATQEQITQAVNQQFRKPETVSQAGSFGRAAAESVIPSIGAAAGAGALLAEANPLAHIAPPYSEMAFGLGGALIGGYAASKAQSALAKAALPKQYEEYERLRSLDVQQNPWTSFLGGAAGAATTFEVAPGQAIKTLTSLPKIIRGTATKAEKLGAIGTSIQAGFGAGQAIAAGDRDPASIAREAGLMMILGHSRWKGLRPSMEFRPREVTPATPEQMAARQQMVLDKYLASGKKVNFVEGILPRGNPTDVAHAESDNTVSVSKKNLHEWLDRDIPEGFSEERAIENLVNHEVIHGDTPTDLALKFEKSMTPLQRWRYRRMYHGPFHEGEKISGANLGKEAIRYELQLASEMEPSEYIFHARQERQAVKFLNVLDRAASIFRSNARTDAQRAIIDRIKAKVEAAKKGAPSASEVSQATEVHGDVRARQAPTGQLPVAQGGPGVQPQAEGRVAQATQIPLKPQAGRGMATIKNPPVVKDVPPGSIHPDSIIPAIRLVNGDVIHGWIKPDGTAATHPEIAKRYEITVEELDRKGWVSKDGKAFYEREPAAKGTLLPTEKKEGELHSTDKPEEAPPVAPTKGAQPAQATAGLATVPPVELTTTAGGPAAKAKLTKVLEEVNIPGFSKEKQARLEELNQKITSPGAKINQAEYEEWIRLTDEMTKAEDAAGMPPAMGRKPSVTEENVDQVSLESPGSLTHTSGIEYGITLQRTDDAIKRLEDGYKAAGKEMVQASMSEDNAKYKAAFGKMNFFGGALQGITRGEHKAAAGNYARWVSQQETPPTAMGRKAPSPEELNDLATRVVASVGGIEGDATKLKMVTQVVRQIATMPPEQWGDALTQFQANYREAEIIRANQKLVETVQKAEALTQAMSPENLARAFSPVDRAGAYRSALYILNKAPVPRPIVKELPKGKTPEQIAATGKKSSAGLVQPESKAVPLKFNIGDYNEFWEGFHARHPEVPQWVANEVWNNALDDFLTNASGEQLRALLTPAKLDKKYLGRGAAKYDPVTGQLDTSMLPRIPDPDPDPILADMKNAPSPEQSVKFKAFMAARDMTPEQGLAELQRLQRIEVEREAEFARRQPQEKGMAFIGGEWRKVTPAEYQEYLARGGVSPVKKGAKGEVFRPGTREPEPMTKQEQRLLEEDRRKGRAALAKRRQKIQSDLKKFFMKDVEAPAERSPMRRTVGLEDIKFEVKQPAVAYVEFDPLHASDMDYLKKVLGRQPKTGMSITLVRDPKTGDYHAVSSHVRGEDPRFYDPAGLPGSKIGNYIGLHNLTSKWSVVGHFLVRDPVYNFHQVWRSGKGTTGKQKFDAEIGDVARARENSDQAQYRKYIKEAEEERAAEKERIRQERFFGGVREEEITGEAAEEKPTTAEEEAEAVEPETSREETEPLSIRERLAREREAAGLRPWEQAEDLPGREVGLQRATEAAMQTWYEGKGKGAQMQGTMVTDLSHLAEQTLVRSEAESLYEIYRELGIKNPFEWFKLIEEAQRKLNEGVPVAQQKMAGIGDVLRLRRPGFRLTARDISAMYAMDKIANKVHERMARSPEERAKVKDLPPIPDDRGYQDMSPEEKQHYDAVENLKYRALIQSFTRIYELTKEATESGPLAEKATAKGVTVPEDAVRFGDRALDLYGPSARRELESAALSALKAPEISGARTLLGGARAPAGTAGLTGTPRTIAERAGGYSFPRPGQQPRMLPGATAEQPMAPASRPIFPEIPTTESQVGGIGPEGMPPEGKPAPFPFEQEGMLAPELEMFAGPKTKSGIIPTGVRESKGFIPQERDPEDVLRRRLQDLMRRRTGEEPPAMTRKGVGVSRSALEEMAAQGRTSWSYQAPPHISKEDLIAGGRELVTSGEVNPEHVMRQFEIKETKKPGSGFMSLDGFLAVRYWDYRLTQWADSIAADPQYGASSPEYQRVEKISADWKRRMDPLRETWGRMGHGMQGWNQIGPDDMRSTTFVRRYLKKVKAEREGVDEDDVSWMESDEAAVEKIVKDAQSQSEATDQLSILIGDAMVKAQDPELDPGQQHLVSQFEQAMKAVRRNAAENLRRKKPPAAMAMKTEQGGLPELDPQSMDEISGIGADVMAELSKSGLMTDNAWLEEMRKVLKSPEVDRPDLEPYLGKIRAVAEEIRETALNNYIGTGDPVKDARFIFTRKRPPLEESIAAIHRALQADPSGEKITPAEAYHVWNYLKTRFFDKGIRDFQVIRTKGSAELGIPKDNLLGIKETPYPEIRLFAAMATNKTMRKLSADMIKQMREEAMVKAQAINWLKNQRYPGWLQTARMFPRFFFWDKILGHGFVPMITHAPTLLFNPFAWSEYFGTYRNGKWTPGAWQEMYRMAIGTKPITRMLSKVGLAEWSGETGKDYHAKMVQELTMKDRFYDWKRAGLQVDPFKYTDDYQIQRLQKIFGPKLEAWTGGRGFDALKTLRYAMAEKWYRSLPEHLQNRKSMELISDSVNHATGIVKTKFHEAANWAFFAPKLEASRWAYIFKDTIKAADIIRRWDKASLEQRAWATMEMKQKAGVVAWYAAMLGINQAMLWMLGSDKKINVSDPKKPDFLQFKAAGFRVGVTSPLVGMVRLFANSLHAAAGERTKFEKLTSRQRQLGETLWMYGRGKMSPFASFGTDIVTQEDYSRRKLPWSTERPTRRELLTGRGPYETKEYLMQTFAPIPIEEAVKETWRSSGMSESEATRWLRILTIAGGMGATGARIADEELEQ